MSSLRALAERWSTSAAGERANFASYVKELCAALGVEEPRPAGSDYQFELPITVVRRDGSSTTNFVDLYRRDHFILEGKDFAEGKATDLELRRAYGQAREYANHDPSGIAPPYVMVMDVARTMLVWDRWGGAYGGFAAARRIDLTRLADNADDAALLRDIWENPRARDPRVYAQAVTKEIAGHLAELAARLEARGLDQEQVSRFLMRCVFTMFAEDVHLLPDEPFRRLLDEIAMADPKEFRPGAEELWRAMDEGRRFGFRKLLRFNGHFFKDASAVDLTREDLSILLEAARADWSRVEPSIFGTLLTRALDPAERHRLGAEYTPPEFIERVVRPAVEEPIRERWTAVQAAAQQLRLTGKKKDADAVAPLLRDFHGWLRALQFLDPACGSGNFLYVTMQLVKRVELEVLAELANATQGAELRLEEVDPSQFHGIEVKPWAREIAELTLWIGFHQFWRAHHGGVQPSEPILRDTGTLENRDAVLAWDEIRRDPSRDRPDPTPRVRHPVTGELVPDPTVKLPYWEYVGARTAEWPRADFIVGNPPYLGQARQREAFGDGYVDALRATYQELPDNIDFVMYWWFKAATAIANGTAERAGFITTSSIVQNQNRTVVRLAADLGAVTVWAIPNHPWVDEATDADVRVAFTVLARPGQIATLISVDHDGTVLRESRTAVLNDDLSAGVNVVRASENAVAANRGLCSNGFDPNGAGFVLSEQEAREFIRLDPTNADVIHRYVNGRDIAARPRDVWIIDFALRTEKQARAYPIAFDVIRERVKPVRDSNARATYRDLWWRFAEARPALREAITELQRYLVTVKTARHRYFTFLAGDVVADSKLICIASADAFHLGVLSSLLHMQWALATSARLGVGNDPTYSKSQSFDPFPFPDPPNDLRLTIADLAERLDAHRKAAIARDERVTMTGMYNVVEKLRSGAALTPKEREVHTLAACGVLRDLHDELDALVARAYGWPWPMAREEVLERLVALHDERVAEEARGVIRWLRPEYQRPRFGAAEEVAYSASLPDVAVAAPAAAPMPWPNDAVGQITALRQLAAAQPITVDEAAARFGGAPKAIVQRHLETLAMLGEAQALGGGRYAVAAGAY